MPAARVGRVQQAAAAVLVRRTVEARGIAAGRCSSQPAAWSQAVSWLYSATWQWPAASMRYSCRRAGRAAHDRLPLTVLRSGSGSAPVEIRPSMSSGGAGLATASGACLPFSYSIHAPSPRTVSAVAADGVVDHAGDHVAAMAGGDHHAEQRQARHVVAGAVDGINQEGQVGVDQHVQQRGVAGRGFLADQHRAGIQRPAAR